MNLEDAMHKLDEVYMEVKRLRFAVCDLAVGLGQKIDRLESRIIVLESKLEASD